MMFEDVIADCRRSKYDEVADVLEHYAEADDGQFGPKYQPFQAPTDDTELAKQLLWAFKAGRASGVSLEADEWQLLLSAASEGAISYSEWPYEDLPDKDDIEAVITDVKEQLNV